MVNRGSGEGRKSVTNPQEGNGKPPPLKECQENGMTAKSKNSIVMVLKNEIGGRSRKRCPNEVILAIGMHVQMLTEVTSTGMYGESWLMSSPKVVIDLTGQGNMVN